MRAERSLRASPQRGVLLIEAMVAILIFALGILGLVALGGRAVGSQSDAQYRTEASSLADAIAGEIAVNVDRTANGANIATDLPAFQHQATGVPESCAYSGAETANPAVLALLRRAGNATAGVQGLPNAASAQQQVRVQAGAGTFNRVEITLCWRTSNDEGAWRRHSYVTYVNGGAN